MHELDHAVWEMNLLYYEQDLHQIGQTKTYLDKVQIIDVGTLARDFLSQSYRSEHLYKKLKIDVSGTLFAPTLPLSDLVHSWLFVKTGKNCEKLLQTWLGDERGENLIGLAKPEDGFKIKKPIQGWLEELGYGLQLLREELNQLCDILILHSIEHVPYFRFSYLASTIIGVFIRILVADIGTDPPFGWRILDYIMMN
jgi:hypothetical protein